MRQRGMRTATRREETIAPRQTAGVGRPVMRPRVGMSLSRTLALIALLCVLSASPVQPRSFSNCKSLCNINKGRGLCLEDGTCACKDGWTGEGCERAAPGISKERRRDGTYGYSFTTEAERGVGAAIFDPQKKVLYVSVYDAAAGADAVFEVDPLNPETFTASSLTSRGWGVAGPHRADGATKQPVALAPDAGYCGTATGIQTATGCSDGTHPRAHGHYNATLSGGWYSVFRGLALDLSSPLTGVFGSLNMHGAAQTPPYKFKIVKYVGKDCTGSSWDDCVIGSANSRNPSGVYGGNGVLDAMASNEVTGQVVYKFSPDNGVSQGKVGMLAADLSTTTEFPIDPTLMNTRVGGVGGTCPACATHHEALRFETATYAQTALDGKNWVIFAGAARMESDGTSYPALFKISADSSDFTTGEGTGQEMYLDGSSEALKLPSACEGVTDAKQGRHTSFTALTKHGSYGYAGTSGRDANCDGCEKRSACVVMFSLDYNSLDSPTKVIVFEGGDGGLDEKDVWAAAVEPITEMGADGGFIYFAVGDRSNSGFGRIVKVMIGGTDTTSTCTSGCFKRVGTFEESAPFGGIVHVADLNGIVSLSRSFTNTTYTKFSTASVTSISPQFVSSTTSGTLVTIRGTGFYSPLNDESTYNVSCRFGHTSTLDSDFQEEAWSGAIYVSSTEIRCTVPSALDSMTSTKTNNRQTYTELEVSFDGFPVDGVPTSGSLNPYWGQSMWTRHNAVVFYYDEPIIASFDVGHGDYGNKVLFTGENETNAPVTLRLFGGPFIDSDGSDGGPARLKCRYNGDATTDVAATFVAVNQLHCPLCEVSNASGVDRCGAHGTSGAAQYIPLPWLPGGQPKADVDVSITMNGVEYHSSGSTVLHLYGSPHGLSVIHPKCTTDGFSGVVTDSTLGVLNGGRDCRHNLLSYPGNAEADGTMKLDPVEVSLADINGTVIKNDMGVGGTRGFKITAAVNATGSEGSSRNILTLAPGGVERTTVDGTTTFELSLSFVPIQGMYEIFFNGEDCTDGSTCAALSSTQSFKFTVSPGKAIGLDLEPGKADGPYLTGPQFPPGTQVVNASQSVEIDYLIVYTVDAGGNKLLGLDSGGHSISAELVTTKTHSNGTHIARSSGAILKGTVTQTMMDINSGKLQFIDLTLDSAAPSGERLPNQNTDITYGDPSRGPHGTDNKYLVQLSTILGGNTAYVHAAVEMRLGIAVYLRVNGTYSVVSSALNLVPRFPPEMTTVSQIVIDATEEVMPVPQNIEIAAYDGGNNWVGANVDDVNITVTSPSDPALELSGTLMTPLNTSKGAWSFATAQNPIYVHTPLINEYTMRFTPDISSSLIPVDQIIRIILGKRGYQLTASLPAGFGPFASATTVLLDTFEVQVMDAGGNFVGSSDRCENTDTSTVIRKIKLSSSTLQLTGTTTLYTAGDGKSTASAVSCLTPKNGTHVIVMEEEEATVDSVVKVPVLKSGTFTVEISVGIASHLAISGNPDNMVSISLGAKLKPSEIAYYGLSDKITPLDVYTIQSVDSGGNLLTSFQPFYENVTTVLSTAITDYVATEDSSMSLSSSSETITQQVGSDVHTSLNTVEKTYRNTTQVIEVNATHVVEYRNVVNFKIAYTLYTQRTITASLNDTSREAYSFTINDNEILNRGPILVADSSYHRAGTLSVVQQDGIAVFSGLHLARPSVGNYELTFTSNDPSFQPAKTIVTVVHGRSHHLGLPNPCDTYLDSSKDLQCVANSTCTCNDYMATNEVALNTLAVHVMDAGVNPVYELDTLPLPQPYTREVFLQAEMSSVILCKLNVSNTVSPCECVGNMTSGERKVSGTSCTSVDALSVTSIDGVARFEGLYMLTPTISSVYGPDGYKLMFSSPGVLDMSFGIKISPGKGYALEVVMPTAFPAPATSKDTFRSALTTWITNPLDAATLKVKILDGGGNFIGGTEPSGRLIYVTCETAELAPNPQGVGVGGSQYAVTCMPGNCATGEEPGVAKFRNIKLLSPVAGSHDIKFSGPGLSVEATYTITVIIGDAVSLRVVEFAKTEYEALEMVALSPPKVAVVDAGGNLVGNQNSMTRLIKVVIAGPRHTFDVADGQDEAILVRLTGEISFERLAIGSPAVGDFNMTFTSTGLLGTVAHFKIVQGPSSRLYIPVTFKIPSTGQMIAPSVKYESLKETKLTPLVVLVLDGGLNYVKDASRTVNVTIDKGNISYTPRNSSLGYLLFDDIVMIRPAVGKYRLTFSSNNLTAINMDITITAGYTAVLDTCVGNSFLTRNANTSYCEDRVAYGSADEVVLRDFQVQVLDAGRVFVGSRWNSEKRNVSVSLDSYIDTRGVKQLVAANNPLVPDFDGAMEVKDGSIGWCKDGYDINPVTQTRIDPATGEVLEYTVYSDSSPSFCREISYSGIAPDVHVNAGLKLRYPKAGTYLLKFTSECSFKYCGDAIYPTLEADILQIRISPGTPHNMKFIVEPPAVNENDFRLNPMPLVGVYDQADNLCTETHSFMTGDLNPHPHQLRGNVAPVIGGVANFTRLRFSAERGKPFTLVFDLHEFGLKLEFYPFMTRPCQEVKPNSYTDWKGNCHCLPGYTEDTALPDQNGTGYFLDLNNTQVAPMSLYEPVVFFEGDWVGALNPYGVCVPCRNGYYKEYPGSHPCTKCPENFDTARIDGNWAPPHNSTSGKILDGPLGKTRLEDCHCIANTPIEGVVWAGEPELESYYRNYSREGYRCDVCPHGGNCTGLDVPYIAAQPGFYRTSTVTTKFNKCPNPEACVGGFDSLCLVGNNSGYTGTLCANCLPGYAHPTINGRFPPRCLGCGNVGINTAIFLVQLAGIVSIISVVVWTNVRRGSDAICLIKTFITYMQTVSLAKDLDLRWPEATSGFMVFMEKLSTIDMRSFSVQCLFPGNYYSETGLYLATPLIMGTALLLYYSVFQFFEEQRSSISSRRGRTSKIAEIEEESESDDDGDRSPVVKAADLRTKIRVEAMDNAMFEESWEAKAFDKVFMLAIIMLWFMYPTLAKYMIGLLQCKRLDTGSDNVFLVADMSIKCYDSTHSGWLFLFFVVLIIYVLGIPLLSMFLLQLEGENHDRLGMRFRVGFLYKGHDIERAWWWDLVIFARKFTMISVVVLGAKTTRVSSYFAGWILEIFMIGHLLFAPYDNERQHKIETYGLVANIFTFNMGYLFYERDEWWIHLIASFVFFAFNLFMWFLLFVCLKQELALEGETMRIARANHDYELEDKIADEFEKRRDKEKDQQKAMEEKAKLDQMIGRPLPFADDNLWEKMRTATVPEMRQDHKELSDKLEDMRSKWKQRWNANVERKYRVDEVHRVKEVSAAEKWRERKAAEQSATLKAREGTLRQTWQERMAQRKAERDKSNGGGR